MFSKKILIDSTSELSKKIQDIKNEEMVQVVQEGECDKVILSKEFLFKLMSLSGQRPVGYVKLEPEKTLKNIQDNKKRKEKGFLNHENNKKQGISEY